MTSFRNMKLNPDDYKNLTEEVLFNRYCGGDLAAFEVLLQRTKGLVYSIILRSVQNRSQADEIFQEVFLKVCKNKDLFREAISFKSWLVTICRNTCIDNSRRQKRSLKTESLDGLPEDDHRALSERVASQDDTPDQTLTIQMENKELAELLDKLPAEQRETFYLKVVSEMTFEEIGQSMSCSTNTAKSRYRYSLETLRGLVRRKRVLGKVI